MMSTLWRYCPCCAGVCPYREWVEKDGIFYCRGTSRYRDGSHPVTIVNGKYTLNYTWCPDVNIYEMIDDWSEERDNMYGRISYVVAKNTFAALFYRMEEEAELFMAGEEFDPAIWAPTFPMRTGELVEQFKGVVFVALADKLPAVLIAIICEYWIH
jgi:hypothetical protein